jgi:hypothetical protein
MNTSTTSPLSARGSNSPFRDILVEQLQYFAYTGDAARFRALFMETWRHVPAPTRGLIQRYLNAQTDPVRVELMEDWSGWQSGVRGQVQVFGGIVTGIRFHAPYMDRSSDAGVRYTIAHELAHVAQFARGSRLTKGEAERDARSRALRWLHLTRRPSRIPALRKYMHAECDAQLREERAHTSNG